MDLGWIEDFRTLAECRSFSRAARLRSISQSAFSKRIRSLEREIGGDLIERTHQPLGLTPLGRQFLEDSTAILDAIRVARTHAAETMGRGMHGLTFSASTSLAQSFYPTWITRKKARMPKMIAQLATSRSLSEEVVALDHGETDFYLTYHSDQLRTAFDTGTFEHVTLGKEEIIPVSVPDPDTGRPVFDIDRFGSGPIPYIARLPGSYIGVLVEKLIAERALPTRVVFAGANGENIMGLLMRAAGIGWMPKNRVSDQLDRGELVPAAGDTWAIPINVRLYRHVRRQRPIVEAFWAGLSRNGDEFPSI